MLGILCPEFYTNQTNIYGPGVAWWLRHCAASRKGSGSMPSVAGGFSVASDSTMCPGFDSASKNEYQINPGGKSGRCVMLTTYHLHVPMSRNLGALTSWNPVGLLRDSSRRTYTGCPGRKEHNFGRVFLMLKYTDITQNTYIQS
jgi:hypothetical protein